MNIRNSILRGFVLALVVAMLSACTKTPEGLVASAKDYLAKGDQKAAVIQLKDALQQNPALAEARFLLGAALFDTGDLPSSEKELRKALELEYPADQVVATLVRVMVAGGRFKAAIDEFGTASIASPQATAELKSALGQAYFATGNAAAARAAFEAALAAQPDYSSAVLGMARVKAAAGDLPGALASIDAALAKTPTFAEGWFFKGGLLETQGQREGALAAYRKAIAAKPDMVLAHVATATLLLSEGKMEETAAQIEAMKKIAPKHPQTYFVQAMFDYNRKDFAAARDAIQQYSKAAPGDPAGLLLSARINYQLKAYSQVDADLRMVLKQFPNYRAARMLLVQMYMHTGQPRNALSTISPLLGAQDLDPDTLELIGKVYAQNGDMVKSAKYLQKSVALDPTNTSKRTTLALVNLGKDEGRQGFEDLEKAAASDAGIRADVALILANVRQKKFDAALAAVASLERKRPDSPLPHNYRGAVLLAKGDAPAARKSFEQALAKDPANFIAAGSLARMDLAENKPDDAKKRLEAVVANDPKSVPALLALAGLRAREGGSTEAVAKLIGQAVAADPADPAPRLALISYYLQRKEPKLALTAAQEALIALPGQPEILDSAGKAYWAVGDTNQAHATYAKLAQLQPTSTAPLMRMAELQLSTRDSVGALASARKALAIKPNLVDAQRMVAIINLDAGKVPAALAMARDMQKQRPNESVGYLLEGDINARQKAWSEATAAYRKGLKQVGTTDLAVRVSLALYATGSDAEAQKFNASWVKEHPDDVNFQGHLADIAMVKKDFSGAEKIYKTLLEAQPNNGMLAARVSRAMYAGGSNAEAEKFTASWLKDHPNDVWFRAYLAEVALGKKDYAEAARQYKTILESEPDNVTVLNNLAWSSGQLKDPKAIEYAEKAAKLAPQSPLVLDTLGTLLVESKNTRRGVELLQKAVALAPNAPAIRLNLARALVADGQKEAAKKELAILEKLGDKNPIQADVAKLKQGL